MTRIKASTSGNLSVMLSWVELLNMYSNTNLELVWPIQSLPRVLCLPDRTESPSVCTHRLAMKRPASRTPSQVRSSEASPISYYLKGNTIFIPTQLCGSYRSLHKLTTIRVLPQNLDTRMTTPARSNRRYLGIARSMDIKFLC